MIFSACAGLAPSPISICRSEALCSTVSSFSSTPNSSSSSSVFSISDTFSGAIAMREPR